MMTKLTPNQTARQKLGTAIKFYRTERGFSLRKVSDIVGASIPDLEAWESGKSAPPEARWARLWKMLDRRLSEMRETYRQALAEDIAERQATATGKLKHRLVIPPEVVKAVTEPPPQPPPKLTGVPDLPPAPPPVDVPETLLGDDFDLRPAYREVAALPDGWRTAEASGARQFLAREMIEKGATNNEIYTAVKAQFGVGIGAATLTEIRARVRAARIRADGKAARELPSTAETIEVSAPPPPPVEPPPFVPVTIDRERLLPSMSTLVPPVAERLDYARMLLRKSPSMKVDRPGGLDDLLTRKFGLSLPTQQMVDLYNEMRATRATGPVPVVKPVPASVTQAQTVNENDVEGAVRLILDAIPNLKTFTIAVDDAGEISVNHTVRQVVESSGSMKIKR